MQIAFQNLAVLKRQILDWLIAPFGIEVTWIVVATDPWIVSLHPTNQPTFHPIAMKSVAKPSP
jgi:hypothetical protein